MVVVLLSKAESGETRWENRWQTSAEGPTGFTAG
jgi:hypothetical protein